MIVALDITDVLNYPIIHNPLWKWGALLVVLLGTFVLGRIVTFLLNRQGRRLEEREHLEILRVLFHSAAKPVQMVFFAGGLYLAQTFLTLDVYGDEPVALGPIRVFWIQAANAVGALAVAWFIFRLVDVLEHVLRRWTSKTDTTLDDQLVPLVRKSLRVFVVIISGLFVAKNIFNMNVSSLIAGLGIGGLAFALAAKDSIANLFGSIVIFADRPFAMGDRVKIGPHEGTVEEVGFRSTKIRTLFGHLVTVPNSVVANEAVENVTRRPYIRRVLNVTVTYDTPPEKLRQGVAILKEMLEARAEHFPADKPPRVFFSDFNADSLNIVVHYWFAPPDWWEYLTFTDAFNIELLERFNDEGIEFAFPTQTLYLRPEGPFATTVAAPGPNASPADPQR